MSIKPILFNQEMVKAILSGRKTVTRRLVKPQPIGMLLQFSNNSAWFEGAYKPIKPKYQTGDILWVRETWNKLPFTNTYIYR